MVGTRRWIVYILRLRNGVLYTGITNDLENRLEQHRKGKGSKYVRAHLPLCLVYVEAAPDRSEASRREWEIKKLTRAKKLELIKEGVLKMADEKKCGGGKKKCCSDPDKDCECDDKECDKDEDKE